MARQSARLFALLASAGLVAAIGCETDHDALQKQPNPPTSAGAAGGIAGSGGQPAVSGGAGNVASGGHSDDEAPGSNLLTIMHGVVDAPSIAVCMAKVGADGSAVPFGDPLSDPPLAYGQSIQLANIAGADLAADVLQPIVIAGELDLIAGLDCADAVDLALREEAAVSPVVTANAAGGAADSAAGAASVAAGASAAGGAAGELGSGGVGGNASGAGGEGGAPPEVQSRLRARSLPALPAGTLNGGRSYLLVANGCLGGSGYEIANGEDYCGAGYSAQNPTASLVFAAVSRATLPAQVGLQVLHASLATDPVSVSSLGPVTAGGSPISIVSSDPEGALEPRPAYVAHTAFDYGSDRGFSLDVTAKRKVRTSTSLQDVTVLSPSWADVLALGGVDALTDGSNYVLVLLGPLVDAKPGPAFLNLPALTIVPAGSN